jgi:hypothetical protein
VPSTLPFGQNKNEKELREVDGANNGGVRALASLNPQLKPFVYPSLSLSLSRDRFDGSDLVCEW